MIVSELHVLPTVKRLRGGQTIYSEVLANEVLYRMENGEVLTEICKDPDMPGYSTVLSWTLNDPAFARDYARARKVQTHAWIDDCITIADGQVVKNKLTGEMENEDVRRADLRIRTRQHRAKCVLPEVYGDPSILAALQPAPGGSTKLTIEFVRPAETIETPPASGINAELLIEGTAETVE